MHLPAPRVGFLLIGHGTRDQLGAAEFLALAEAVAAELAPAPSAACFLELREPAIAAAVETLVRQGIDALVVAPVLLFAAGHARQDIPQAVAAALAPHRQVRVAQAEALGCHPDLLELSAELAEAALAGGDWRETRLVVVARGSPDVRTQADVAEFVRRRSERSPAVETRLAYIALASPRLEVVLNEVALARPRRVIVQPHLLFQGELYAQVRRRVAELAASRPETNWQVTTYLGAGAAARPPSDAARRLASAVAARCRAACAAMS